MSVPGLLARPRGAGSRPPIESAADVQRIVWPIMKRMPAYLRLGWALGREPAIRKRNKALLLSAVLYTVTPAHVLASAVPVVGQVDNIVLYLLGLRQALKHCPADICQAHLARLGLRAGQLDADLADMLYVAGALASKAGTAIGVNLRFAGKVAKGFARRAVSRWLSQIGVGGRGGSRLGTAAVERRT